VCHVGHLPRITVSGGSSPPSGGNLLKGLSLLALACISAGLLLVLINIYRCAFQVQSNCLFQLLLSLETPSPDPLNIGELVKEEKPLKAIDFCYHDESEMVTVLDCISLCVMVVAYAADSVRGHQMLVSTLK
jgi:hypothetical protein